MPQRVGIRTLLVFVATASSLCGGMSVASPSFCPPRVSVH